MPHKPIPKTAMVFGAGKGERMRPLTNEKPKPMVEVCGKPMISYTLDKLREAGVKKVVVNTHYKADILKDYLQKYPGLEIVCLFEETLLNTGGGLLAALPELGNSPFYVINGDIIWTDGKVPLLHKMVNEFKTEMNAQLVLQPIGNATGYSGSGDFDINKKNLITISESKEKPYVFTGIQLFNPKLMGKREISPFSIIEVYKEHLQKDGSLKNVQALVHDGSWLHIGTPEGVTEAETVLAA